MFVSYEYRGYLVHWSRGITVVESPSIGPSGNIWWNTVPRDRVLEDESLVEALRRLDELIEEYLDKGLNIYGGRQPL